MATWIKDDNGNTCSVEKYGSEEAAKAALDLLQSCGYEHKPYQDSSDTVVVFDAKPGEHLPLIVPHTVRPGILGGVIVTLTD